MAAKKASTKNVKNDKKAGHGKIHKPENMSKELPLSFCEGQKKGKKPEKDKNGMIFPNKTKQCTD